MMFVNLKDNFASQESQSFSHNCWSVRLWKYVFRKKTHTIVAWRLNNDLWQKRLSVRWAAALNVLMFDFYLF